MTKILLIALGGALGAVSRYGLNVLIQSRLHSSGFPWGTFVINVSGSFVLGLLMTLLAAGVIRNTALQPMVGIGFIGAYTTFSTFEYETAQLGMSWKALLNIVGSVVVGYMAVWIGIKLAELFGAGR